MTPITSELTRKDKEKEKIEKNKSMGPLNFLYRETVYKPIGPRPEDFLQGKMKNNAMSDIENFKQLDDLKKHLWEGIGMRIRPKAWKMLFKYTPLNTANDASILAQKREEYMELVEMNREEVFEQRNDTKTVETIKLIKKDVLRTLPETYMFRNKYIQKAMVRILLIFSVRNPSSCYAQGMNDIVAPIFCVFVSEAFKINYIELENNFLEIEKTLTEEALSDAEADAFHCFSLFLSGMKQNYIKGFFGVNENLKKLNALINKCDKPLQKHFKDNETEIFHFSFRWCLCLLLREFPLNLSIKLMDYYLTEEYSQDELCIYLMLSLILKFSFEIKQRKKEQIIIFFQNLPTQNWGDQDIQLLVSEAFTLRSLFKIA